MNRQTTTTIIRASAILTSAFVAANDFPVPANAGRVTVHLKYTRNGLSTTGYPSIKIQWKSTTDTLDGNKLVAGSMIQTPETYTVGPSAATIVTPIVIPVPDGATNLTFSIAETGDTTNLGTAELRASLGDISP